MTMFDHNDNFAEIDKNIALGKKLSSVHNLLKAHYPFISRIAAALYDPKTDMLKTFVHSSGEASL